MAVKANGSVEGILPENLVKLLKSLGSKWGDVVDSSTMEVDQLSGAMTNKVYRVSWPTKIQDSPRNVLVRMYGDGVDIFFDREEEIRTFEGLSEKGYGPKLLGQVLEGRVEEFLHARTLSADDLRDPDISSLIAAKMREFHNLNMPGAKVAVLWNRLRKWLSEAKHLCHPEHAQGFALESLENEITVLEEALSSGQQDIGFCHNDLQYGNIMIVDKTIIIIDYEYASYNPVAYDIANHFCEMAADYHTDTPHVLNYEKYPDIGRRQRFIHQYLISAGRGEPTDREVNQFADDVEKYTLANHIFWGLWGIISSCVNQQIDFNYMEYARQRFEQYKLTKSDILKLKVNSS